MSFRLTRWTSSKAWLLVAGFGILGAFSPGARGEGPELIIPPHAVWKYLDDGSDQGSDWLAPDADDRYWAQGPAKLGYGNGGSAATTVSYGPSPGFKNITTYFRHPFSVTNAYTLTNLTAWILRVDGAVGYLNGVEIFRSNMPDELIDYYTFAETPVAGAEAGTFFPFAVDPSWLVEGYNVLAVEIHKAGFTGPDLGFDLELLARRGPPPPPPPLRLTRGPYLQSGTPSSVVIRWRSNIPTNSVVRYGVAPAALALVVTDPRMTNEHIVTLNNLLPGTRYYYAVGASDTNLAGGSGYSFVTFPPAPKPTRIWAIGDSGTTGTGAGNAVGVRNAYEAFAAGHPADVWLMLGDNAYYSGTDQEYQNAVFNVYTNELRSTVLWSTIGNHESNQDPNPSPTIPYFQIFSFPQNGEAGGVASGTKNYYSFDYGSIHFVCLDAMTATSRLGGSAMLTWLESDLAANTNEWLIAFWHHPPYTKGSHDSDTEIELIQMRTNVVPILESYGVDLVLGGHSHNYERSYLLNGHYGRSTTLTPAMIRDAGNGRPSETGAYLKPTAGPSAGQGTVYVVAGSSGWATYRFGFHPAMLVSELQTGSMLIDVSSNRLDAIFLRETGAIDDSFTIIKGVPAEPLRLATFSTSYGKTIARWKSIAGHNYQLQWTPSLEASQWTPVGSPTLATGATTSATNSPPPGFGRSFYRVVEVPL